MVSDSANSQRILLVTGLSGAGKSTALDVLEDLGWETIDNFPIRLLGGLVGSGGDAALIAIGFDSRTRGFVPAEIIELCKQFEARDDIELTTLFIDCGSTELERRYNETRRPHPMARGRPALDGIKAERELLEPLRRWADIVIDTTNYATNQLQQVVREHFADRTERDMTVTISSFGFARGMPPLADLLFDMRFLDNPHWIDGLRELTGLDAPVGDHIAADPAFAPAFDRIIDLLREVMPHYAAQGRSYLNIAFGCTGGRHRSVYTAERAAQVLREAGFSPTVLHRNLGSRPADPLERR
ncbi:RNase adapter RapZ [Qipengyuania qiaonensis]|uniref:RNase adapter RapZ n=1 Tax=Qipengyuania qiaonensis TaxID=2867240 RepID=A0ABS7JCN7_9SPHN|nr:RNase adapter RapZ [Qipengyuania qiaonensis]MBX7483720.1 RNase adapter RapZ [Qipengyuania qiaonensis]